MSPGRGDAAVDAAPGHDRGVGRESALQNLVPADELAALAVDEGFDLAGEPALQLLLGLEALGLHAGLALGAGLPVGFVDLVAADVNVLAGEKIDDLG